MTSQKKYVVLRDADRYFVLKYTANGQSVIASKSTQSKITQKIKDTDLDLSEKPHFTHTTQEGVLILVHLHRYGNDIKAIQVQSGVYILALSFDTFDSDSKY